MEDKIFRPQAHSKFGIPAILPGGINRPVGPADSGHCPAIAALTAGWPGRGGREYDYCRPRLGTAQSEIRDGRHPVVERFGQQELWPMTVRTPSPVR